MDCLIAVNLGMRQRCGLRAWESVAGNRKDYFGIADLGRVQAIGSGAGTRSSGSMALQLTGSLARRRIRWHWWWN